MKIVLLVLIIVFAFWVSGVIRDNDFIISLIKRFGYAGIFIIAVVGGLNLIVPVPAFSFFPVFFSSGLDVLTVVIITAAGMTFADFIGYLLGKTGRHIALPALEKRMVGSLEKFKNRIHWSPALVLFLFASFAPIPNEVVVIPMAFLGYRFSYIMLPVFFGNMVFNALYAAGVINVLKLKN